ncbi:MAG: hypothetical protein ABMA13_01420 [Chthoniobacteraceae bacterium]
MKFTAVAILLFVVGLVLPRSVARRGEWIVRILDRLGERPWACLGGFAVLSFAISVLASTVLESPAPRVHDEFAYLMQAETFLHGRLKNEPHPLWQHFETFHVISSPIYAAKFPPAQALVLAAGMWLGSPIYGVWISTALSVAALLWMFFAWLPRRWAVVAAILTTLNPLLLLWNWSFWGGSIALGAGALVLSGWRRVAADDSAPRNFGTIGAAMGLGMGLLTISRPFEGFVMCLLVMSILGVQLLRSGRLHRLVRVLPPLLLVLALSCAFLLHYNRTLTGSATTLPYLIYERAYDSAPLFLWEKIPPIPEVRHWQMHDFYQHSRQYAEWQRSLPGFIRISWQKLAGFRVMSWNWLVLLLFLPLPLLLRDWWMRAAIFVCVGCAAAMSMSTYVFEHYAAPVLPLSFVLLAASMQAMSRWQIGQRPAGACAVGLVASWLLFMSFAGFYIRQSKNQRGDHWGFHRRAIAGQLASDGNKHVVFVDYERTHNLNREWVYNGADIDAGDIVWARDMGPEENRKVTTYFASRRAWAFNPDLDKAPRPYPPDAR